MAGWIIIGIIILICSIGAFCESSVGYKVKPKSYIFYDDPHEEYMRKK